MRIAVPILALLLGLVFAYAIFKGPTAAPTTPATPTPAVAPAAGPTDVTGQAAPSASPAVAVAPGTLTPATPAPAAVPAPAAIGKLRLAPAEKAVLSTLGSAQRGQNFQVELQLTGWGGGIYSIRLTDYFQKRGQKDAYTVQQPLKVDVNGQSVISYPFAARAITVNGQWFDLAAARWHLVEPGHYRIELIDESDTPVVRIVRRYSISAKSGYDIHLDQQVHNLSGQPLVIVWEQNLVGEMPVDEASYMGDIRNFMSGYLNPSYDPKRKIVFADKGIVVRRDMLQKGRPLWPTKDAPAGAELVWISALNRYFAAAVHPTAAASAAGPVQTLQQTLPVVGFQTLGFPSGTPDHDTQRVVITAATRAMAVQPGQSADLSLSLYAGPRKGEIFHAAPYDALGMEQLVRYELGCTWCTFQFLAHWLLAFLKGIHALLADWALAIIILVLVVRLILHPITKKAQINMTKMQRQMGQLQPEIEKLKKKYGDDQQKLNQEMMALYRDKGVNFTGALGCLPMFLQMPIWIALYAMLYFAIELRHEPAFYGFFQWITAGKWSFLADLAAPDHFIVFFDTPKPIHLLIINLDYSALNILPILMGITYWFQQQMMTPPPANEQMAQQQKMMKWMMLLFPFMLYSMPSGLTLYMLVSSWAGMLDSWVVKRHIAQQEAAGTLLDQAKPKQPGRLGLWLASKQKELEEKAKSAQRNPPPRKR